MPSNLVPPEAEILHDSEGLTIHRNPKNRFVVATLYYYADPAKRKPEWAQTVQAGMTEAQWAKEYLIDYTAQSGERAFPEITDKRENIIVQAGLEFDGGPMWGGFDYGARNPSSFHVYTHQDGAFYAIWELYKPCKNIPEFAAELKSCPYYHRLKYIAADPTIFDKRTHNSIGLVESVANLFIKEGVTKFIAGSQDESAWLGVLRKHWELDDTTFKICTNCPNLIREFEQATYEDYASEKTADGKNYKEGIRDKDNHALDDNKYFFNSQPVPSRTYVPKSKINLADKWYGWSGNHARKHTNLSEGFQGAFNAPANRRKEFI